MESESKLGWHTAISRRTLHCVATLALLTGIQTSAADADGVQEHAPISTENSAATPAGPVYPERSTEPLHTDRWGIRTSLFRTKKLSNILFEESEELDTLRSTF